MHTITGLNRLLRCVSLLSSSFLNLLSSYFTTFIALVDAYRQTLFETLTIDVVSLQLSVVTDVTFRVSYSRILFILVMQWSQCTSLQRSYFVYFSFCQGPKGCTAHF